jgi:predicted PurR-regulated permease PerM
VTTIPAHGPGAGEPPGRRPLGDEILSTRAVLRIVAIVLVVIGTVLLVRLLWQPIGWVIIAAFVAIALSGPVSVLEKKMPRALAIALVYLLLLLIPAGIAAAVIPPVVDQGVGFVNDLPRYTDDLQQAVESNDRLSEINRDFGVTTELRRLAEDAPNHIGEAAGVVRDVGSGLFSGLLSALTILVLSIFMTARGRVWVDGALRLHGGKEAQAVGVALDRIANAVGHYVAGAAIQATIAGLAAFIVLSILGVPFAGALAVLVALFDLIPLVGATIAGLIVLIVTLFTDFPTATIVWVIFGIAYQQFENYVIQPQIHKRAVQLEPFVVLISVICGGVLFGIVGALLAIPIAASIQIGAQEWWRFRLDRKITAPPGDDEGEAGAAPEPAGS